MQSGVRAPGFDYVRYSSDATIPLCKAAPRKSDAVSIRTDQASACHCPGRSSPGGCSRFTGIGTHLNEGLLHRLFRSASLQIFHHRGQRPNDILDFFSCHAGLTPGRPRLGADRLSTARFRAAQCAAPRRKGYYQPKTSQLQNRSVATPFLQTKGCGWGRWSVSDRTLGYRQTELKKSLVGQPTRRGCKRTLSSSLKAV